MQRSSSFAKMTLQFNPTGSKVGCSSIDKLPIRRSNSQKNISKVSEVALNTEKTTLQSQKITIDMLNNVNESLERENKLLRNQLDFFLQACSSRRNSITQIPLLSKNSVK